MLTPALTPTRSHTDTGLLPDATPALEEHAVGSFLRMLKVVLLGLCIHVAYIFHDEGFLLLHIANYAGIALILVAHYFLSHGSPRRAITLVIWGAVAILAVQCLLVNGLHTPGLIYAPMICISAAWLISVRMGVGVFAAFAVIITGIVVAEYGGYQPPTVARPSLSIALVILTGILGSLAIAAGAITSLKKHLARILELTREQAVQMEALRQSEARFSMLFRANPTPCSTVDDNEKTTDVNDAWVRMFGIAAQDAIGKTTAELGLWTDASMRRVITQMLRVQGRVDGLAIQFNTVTGPRPFLIYIARVEIGGKQRMLTSLLDQTYHMAAEAAQRAVQEELEARVTQRTEDLSNTVDHLNATRKELVQSEKLASLGAMVAGISHELNTPIGNTVTVASTLQFQVKSFRKLLDSGGVRKSELTNFLGLVDEMADVVVRSTHRAAELVTSFKQVAVDRSSERRREFELHGLVNELVTALKPGMRTLPVTFEVNVPRGIICDSFPGPVGQVLTNLLQNAVTHAFSGAAPGTICITTHEDGPRVVVQVRDDGKGMDAHTLKHAFDPFFTTRLGQGGSGLGLSVSHRIADTVLGGGLSAQSAPGYGSCFTFSFLRCLPKDA